MSNTISFLHSGDMGDIVAGMAAIKELCEQQNKKAVLYLDTTGGMTCNDQKLNDLIRKQSNGLGLKFNDTGYDFLVPLIEIQPYIERVEKWTPEIKKVDINLNKFRHGFYHRKVILHTNQNLLYMQQMCCRLKERYNGPWLKCEKKDFSKKIVVARSCRYQSASEFYHAREIKLGNEAYFIGTDTEYSAFSDEIRTKIERFPVTNALDAAVLINSSNLVICNGTLFYWIAAGLGKTIINEVGTDTPTTQFKDANNIKYIKGFHFI